MVLERCRGKEMADAEGRRPTDCGLATSATWFNQGGTESAQRLGPDPRWQSLATSNGRRDATQEHRSKHGRVVS